MKKFIVLLVVIAIAVGAFFAVPAVIGQKAADSIADGAKQLAATAALENMGGMNSIEDTLRDNVITLATDSGLTVSQVSSVLDGLNITSWDVCDLPSDAEVSRTFDYEFGEVSTTITVYKDPAFLTATILDIPITFNVPADSQDYIQYVELLA